MIGRPEGRWQRTPEKFRSDLEWLYANNYYPLNLRDLLNGFGAVPAGKTPVVLTFDDSTIGQFNYLAGGKLDPDCAAGILKRFHDQHPGWPLKATFFVLIETNAPSHNLFGQPEYAARKLRQIEEWGMEIGAHTYSHDRLDQVSSAAARRSLERETAFLSRFISAEIVSLALPEGKYPPDLSVLSKFKLVAEVAGGLNPVKFDPLHIKRVQTIGPEWRKFFGRRD
ncbi:MAG: polysaccharide deacetylase family protein [Candidatus Saganbacteria bacterium]|nr:polysaccharide deacetylase family protein [Candidatus Saganbacteria bacterium]